MSDNINIGIDQPAPIHIAIVEEQINLDMGLGAGIEAGGGIAIQGSGTYIRNAGTVQFSNSNNISFGLGTNGVMTASHDALLSSLVTQFVGTGTTLTNAFATLNSNGMQLNIPEGSIYLMDANGVSWSSSSSGLSTSITASIIEIVGFAGTGTSGTNVTMTLNSNGLALSVDPPGAGGGNWSTSTQTGSKIDISTATDVNTLYYGNFLTVAAGAGAALKGSGTYSQNSGTIEFANSNDITFGLTNNQMTASFSQSTHAHDYLLTVNSSLLQHTSATSVVTSAAFPSSDTTKFAGPGFTTTAITGTEVVGTHNSLGLKIGVPAYITTYAAGGGEIAFSAGASSDDLASIIFSNSNNVSFGLNGSTITGSASFSQSVQAAVLSLNGSSGSLSLNIGSSLSSSVNGSAITFGLISDWTSVIQSAGNYLTSAAQVSHSHGNPTLSLSNLSGATSSASDGFTLSLTGHNAGYSATSQFSSAFLTGYTETQVFPVGVGNAQTLYTSGTIIVNGQNNITVNSSVGTGASSNSQYIQISGPNAILEVQASNGTLFGGSAYLGGYSNLTISQTNNTFRFSVADAIPLGNSTAYATSVLSATFQQTGNYLTTAALSNHTHSNLYIALANSTDYATSVLSNTFQTTGAYLTTAMASDAASNFAGTNLSTETTSGDDLAITFNSSGLHLGIPAWITVGGTGGGGDWSISSTAGTEIVISTGTATNTLYQPLFITTQTLDTQFIGLLSTGLTGGSWTINSSQLSLNIPTVVGTLGFNDSNGVTFGVASTTSNSSTVVTASIAAYIGTATTITTTSGTDLKVTAGTAGLNIAHPAWLTTAATGGGGGVWSVATTNAGTDIVISTASDTNTLYHPAYLTTYAAGGGSLYSGDFISLSVVGVSTSISVTNTSSITSLAMNTSERANYFYTSNNTFLTTAAASDHTHDYQSTGNYLTTAAGTGSTLTTTGGTNLAVTYNSDGLAIAYPAWITTYSPGGGGADWSISSITGTDILISTATNTITLYQPDYITGYTESTHAFTQYVGLTSTAITGGSATIASDRLLINIPSNAGNLYYNDSNGVTFGASSDGSSTTITASVNTGGAANWLCSTSAGTAISVSTGELTNTLYYGPFITAAGAAPNRRICEIIPFEYAGRVKNISATQISSRVIFNPFWLDGNGLVASTVRIILSNVTNARPPIMTYGAGIYQMINESSLALYDSTTATVAYGTAQSASFTGIRAYDITGMSKTLSEGRWVLGLYFNAVSTSNCDLSLYGASGWPNILGYISGASDSATIATHNTRHLYPFMGFYSTTTNDFPSNVTLGDVFGGRSADAYDFYAILKEI